MKRREKGIFFDVGMRISAIVFVLFALLVVYSLSIEDFTKNFYSMHKYQVSRMDVVRCFKNDLTLSSEAIKKYLFSGNRYYLGLYNDVMRDAGSDLEELEDLVQTEDELYLLRSISDSLNSYFLECSNAAFLYNSRDYDYYSRFYYSEEINTYLKSYTDELLSIIIEASVEADEKSKALIDEIDKINMVAIPMLLLTVILSILYLRYILTSPLGRLVTEAREISKGNYNAHVSGPRRNNSVGLLIETFNRMSDDISRNMTELQEKVETEEKLFAEQRKNLEYESMLHKAQFAALQIQTNPHFLFNTLNSISRTITLGKTEQSQEMLSSLADLLRYSLSDGDIPAALSEELAITGDYLGIQRIRFGERVKVDVDVPKDIADTLMLPRFTLQPLVENAIIHGLEPKMEGGTIHISARRIGDDVFLKIADDGVGMKAEKLEMIRRSNVKSKRIGLENTRERMRLFTGSDDSFDIESNEGEGTTVILKFRGGRK